MNDLFVLKELPGHVDPPDEAAKDRIRGQMSTRVATGSRRAPRPTRKVVVVCAALVLGGVSVAATAVHAWTSDHPVAIPSGTPQDGFFTPDIPNPDRNLTTPGGIESTVAEFEAAIRLPEGGSFEPWTQHVVSSPSLGYLGGAYTRNEVVQYMVNASSCQWAQQWLTASTQGDGASARQATQILGDMNQWATATGYPSLSGLQSDIGSSDTAAVKYFEDSQCAYTGSWGAAPAKQDARAFNNLTPAIGTAQEFLSSGGDARAFTWDKADALNPTVLWGSAVMQPSPFPGVVVIAESASPGISLVSISETGKQFCALLTPGNVVRGTTSDDIRTGIWTPTGLKSATPDRVTCSPES